MDIHHVAKEIGWFLVLTCVVHSCSEVIDPAAIFSMLYGSEHFEEYIGQLDVVSMASLDILSERDQTDTKMIIEKMRVNLYIIYEYVLLNEKPLITFPY